MKLCPRASHNLIRSLMADVSAIHHVDLWRISFKGTADRVRHWAWLIQMAPTKKRRRDMIAELLATIATDPVPMSPHRREPRVKKRRPKSFPLMTKPHHLMKEVPHRGKHAARPKRA